MYSGARQWRHDCDCAPEVAAERTSQKWERMHSQISKANVGYFTKENRVDEDINHLELRRRHSKVEGTLIVCNVCGDIKEVDT
jgi:hypothetical protein